MGPDSLTPNSFAGVQGFMGDRSYSFPEALANEILGMSLKTFILRSVAARFAFHSCFVFVVRRTGC